MINTIQIIDILNDSKYWVIKWSGHSEKGMFTTEVAGKHKVISKFIENYPKYESVEVVLLYKNIGENGIMLFVRPLFPVL